MAEENKTPVTTPERLTFTKDGQTLEINTKQVATKQIVEPPIMQKPIREKGDDDILLAKILKP